MKMERTVRRRVTCLALLLCMLVSLLPTSLFGVYAEERLPKDETGLNAQSGQSDTELYEKTEYDAHYVGADGSKTVNGGSLVALFSAFGEDGSLHITEGRWLDKQGGEDAVLWSAADGGLAWTKGARGGAVNNVSQDSFCLGTAASLIGIRLSNTFCDLASFTVETSAVFIPIGDSANPSSAAWASRESFRLDALYGNYASNIYAPDVNAQMSIFWKTQPENHWYATGAGNPCYRDTTLNEIRTASGEAPGTTLHVTKNTAENGNVTYSTGMGGKEAQVRTVDASGHIWLRGLASKEGVVNWFTLFNGVAAEVYAIRVYSAPLTSAERTHNAFIDLMAHAGASLSSYLRLDDAARVAVETAIAQYSYGMSADVLEREISEIAAALADQKEAEDLLYVSDGLIGVFAAYRHYSTGALHTAAGMQWLNGLDRSQVASLRGAGWTVGERGGFYIERSLEEYHADRSFGVYLPETLLRDGDYTLEMVTAPIGISTTDENGERIRYIDDVTPTGTYNEYGIAVGPMRAFQFACYRPSGLDGQMERRWVYSHTGGLSGAGWKYRTRDMDWEGLAYGQVVSNALTFRKNAESLDYAFFGDCDKWFDLTLDSAEYKTNAQSGNMFQVMVGVAGTVYAVRMYDRVLSEAEMQQNRLADLCYYYGLDISGLQTVIDKVGIFDGMFAVFSDMSFLLTEEQAQREFDSRLTSLWLSYLGVGARKDGTDGLRYYFKVNDATIASLLAGGCRVETGILVNVTGENEPLLESGAYDYRIVAYDSEGGRNTPFFVDDETAALTVLYRDTDKAVAVQDVFVRGYVKLTVENEETLVFYCAVDGGEYSPYRLFNVYHALRDTEAARKNVGLSRRIEQVVSFCYESRTVHLDASAAAGGDGSAQKPYRSFAEALDATKEILKKASAPTRVTLLMEDGEYGVYGRAILTGEDMPFRYSELEITSRNGKSILTTTVSVDTADFVSYADNVWVCQLEREADGTYPSFRYLYVDGKRADVAYSTGRHATDEDIQLVDFDRDYDGIYETVKALYKAELLSADTKSPYPADRKELNAAFERHKQAFLAFGVVEEAVRRGTLTRDTAPASGMSAQYRAFFEEYKLNRLALMDLEKQYKSAGASGFKAFSPSLAADDVYKSVFVALRDQMVADGKVGSFASYILSPQPDDSIAQGKFYLPLTMVDSLREELLKGKNMAQAHYGQVKARYDAADAAGKAAMQSEMDEALLRVSAESWYRFALSYVGLEMHMAGQWWFNIVSLTGIDYDDVVTDSDGELHVACYLDLEEYKNFHVFNSYSMVGRYVCIKNALDFVDSEGEFYYDEAQGRVYYYTAQGMRGRTAAYPTSDHMLDFSNVHNVTLSGLILTGVDDRYMSDNACCYGLAGTEVENGNRLSDRSALRFNFADSLTVYGCTFRELGGKAVQGMGRLENIRIESCIFENIGDSGIYLGNGYNGKLWGDRSSNENVVITDNYLHRIATEYHASTAIFMNTAKDVQITHNTVEDCAYTGIGIGFTFSTPDRDAGEKGFYNHYNVEIAYNYIRDFMTESGDGAAIYVTGGNAKQENTAYFNQMHHNYVVMTNRTGNARAHMLVGLYFDGSSSNWTCKSNVVVAHSYGAAKGENDELYDSGDRDILLLRRRYAGVTLIYLQHIDTQLSHNILCEDNYVINVRATDPEAQRTEVYKTYVDGSRNLVERDTHYVNGVDHIPMGADEIIYAAGCYGQMGDPNLLYGNDY